MDTPENKEAFLITGQLNARTVADAAYTDITATSRGGAPVRTAIVQSRLEETPLALQGAYKRAVKMSVGRVRAYGEKWRAWVNAGRNCADPRCIPLKHRDKTALVFDEDGSYELHDALLKQRSEAAREGPAGANPGRDGASPAAATPEEPAQPAACTPTASTPATPRTGASRKTDRRPRRRSPSEAAARCTRSTSLTCPKPDLT
jgi:hypothetical protein